MASSKPSATAQPPPAARSARRLSLCNDVVFKTLFSRHTHLLSDLINAVRYPAAPITVRRILNPHILPEELAGKHIVLDILAEDADGRRLGVEMQLQRFLHWPQRNVYGVARSLAAQLKAGHDYRQLKPTIGISLLVEDLFIAHPHKATWHFTLRDAELPRVELGEALQVHIIELKKAETLRMFSAPLQAWVACLLHNLKEAVMSDITHPPVKEALKHLETLYSDEELRHVAYRRELALIDAQDIADYARQEGEQQGLKKGMEQGRLALRQSLQSLMRQKFGPLPEDTLRRIHSADMDALQHWLAKVLSAQRIEDVFI